MSLDLTVIPIRDLPLQTSIGTLGLHVIDGSTLDIWAGGYACTPDARFGPLRINRIAVDINAHLARDEHGDWQPDRRYGLQVYRARTFIAATWNARNKASDAILPPVRAWAKQHPEALDAAQYRAYCDQITDEQTALKQLYDQIVQHERQLATLTRHRDQLANRHVMTIT